MNSFLKRAAAAAAALLCSALPLAAHPDSLVHFHAGEAIGLALALLALALLPARDRTSRRRR